MDSPAERSIAVLRMYAEAPGAVGTVHEYSLFELAGMQSGFAVVHGGGVTLVRASRRAGTWTNVFISAGLALDVPDVAGALRWTNEQNQRTQRGRYYATVSQDGSMAALVYEQTIWAGHLRHLLEGPHGPGTLDAIVGWVGSALTSAVEVAAASGSDALREFGGRRFPPDEDGFTTLFFVTD